MPPEWLIDAYNKVIQGQFLSAGFVPYTHLLGDLFWTGLGLLTLFITYIKTGNLLTTAMVAVVWFSILGFTFAPELLPIVVIASALGLADVLYHITMHD